MSATAFQRKRREAQVKEQAKIEDISSLKVSELKALCDKRGIVYDPKATKEDLIKLLEGAE